MMCFASTKYKLLITFSIIVYVNLYAQNFENHYYQINFTNKIVGKKIVDGDTLQILEKKAGSKYVDSLTLSKLNKKINYNFILPDSMPDGKYCSFYNDKKQNLIFTVKYEKNKKNGPYVFYHYNKSIRLIGFYNYNCIDKVEVEYSNTGQVVTILNFENCKLNGNSYVFSTTGEFSTMTNYKNGDRNGETVIYRYNNKRKPEIMNIYEYKDGKVIKKVK